MLPILHAVAADFELLDYVSTLFDSEMVAAACHVRFAMCVLHVVAVACIELAEAGDLVLLGDGVEAVSLLLQKFDQRVRQLLQASRPEPLGVQGVRF